jgi:Concanavalin A-like lectin/glucanases superfamily
VLTAEAWVRGKGGPGTPAPGPAGCVLSKGAASCSFCSYGLIIRDNTGPSGGMTFFIGNYTANQYSSGADAHTLWDNNWHHVAGTYDGRIVRLYMDAVEVAPGQPAILDIDYKLHSNDRLYIGAFRGTCNQGIIADIDEVRLWKGALTAGEIKARFRGEELP